MRHFFTNAMPRVRFVVAFVAGLVPVSAAPIGAPSHAMKTELAASAKSCSSSARLS